MNFENLSLVLLLLATASQADKKNQDNKVQEKRASAVNPYASKSTPQYARAEPSLSAYATVSPYKQQKQQLLTPSQQYYSQEATSGGQQYAQEDYAAYAQAVPAKAAAAPVQYSLAADVSSFSYSSPLVSYNNLGVSFPQHPAGKASQAQAEATVQYRTAPKPVAHSKAAYQTEQPKYYAQIPSKQYAQQQQQSLDDNKLAYAQQVQAYLQQQQAYAQQAQQPQTQQVVYAQQGAQHEPSQAEYDSAYAQQVHAYNQQQQAYAAAQQGEQAYVQQAQQRPKAQQVLYTKVASRVQHQDDASKATSTADFDALLQQLQAGQHQGQQYAAYEQEGAQHTQPRYVYASVPRAKGVAQPQYYMVAQSNH